MTTEPGLVSGTAGAGPDAAAVKADADRRLHPMSWLFVLLAQLRQFVVPLIALFVFGRGDRNELWPMLGLGALVIASLWRYFTYRYGVGETALVIRSGLLERSLRVIPFARIQNVAIEQSVLHRLFGVAEVRLESAGGQKPEAEMRVLQLADALALEQLVRDRSATAAPPAGADTVPAADTGTALLALPPGELVRLGLVSNRGMIVVGAAVAGLSQFSPRLLPDLFRDSGTRLQGWAGAHQFGWTDYALGALSLFAVFVVVLRLFSVLLAVLQYHGFVLRAHGRRLTVERGLLGRWRTSASRRRIQAWTLREGPLHRLLRRRSLEVDTAVAEGQQQRALRELAPIATPQACQGLIETLLPRAAWPALAWQPLPTRFWWRLCLPGVPWNLLIAAALTWRFGPPGLLALLWLPWAAFAAWRRAARAAWALGAEVVAVREGWWNRHWRFAEIDKLQALQLTRSPLDRRCGTATLWLDTAGAGALAPPLRIRFLPEAEARDLQERLARDIAARPLRW